MKTPRLRQPKIFITGIPTAGKSYLAQKIKKATGSLCLETDNLWEGLAQDPRFLPWANFFEKQDEYDYYTQNSPDEQWRILEEHYEKIWPGVLEKIRAYENGNIPIRSKIAARMRKPINKNRPLIFEGINILPRLARQDLDFPGIVLVGKSFEDVLRRNKERPRWGATEKMLRMGAEAFWFVERPRYIKEAEKYGYGIFETADDAYEEAIKILGI